MTLLIGSAAAAPAFWHLMHEYQRQRVLTFLDPTSDPLGSGFHIIQSTIAIGSGGFWGKGWMQGTQTHLDFVPERTTDFILAVYSEEFGLMGNLVLIGLYALLVLRCLAIASATATLFHRLLAAALGLVFFTYAFVNIGMVSGVLPVVGVPLPLMSYGGTAMVTLGVGLGLVMAAARERAPRPE
jgi:rod shape determining protein RodA